MKPRLAPRGTIRPGRGARPRPGRKPRAAALVTAALALAPLRAEVENDIPIGLETVTGARSGYVYRGFDLAGALMDFQVEGEVVLREDLLFNAGGWLASEFSGDFAEGTGFADLRYEFHERFTAGLSASYHAFDHHFFDNGFDLGATLAFHAGEEWDATIGAHRDFGAGAWYAYAEAAWSRRLSDDAFLSLSTGLSAVDSYYGRSGFNDFYGRAALTYNVNRMISLTPFVGWSLELDEADGHELFRGLWFEVSF